MQAKSMRIIGSVYEKDYVYPWDARGREVGIIKMPAAGDVERPYICLCIEARLCLCCALKV